MTKEMTMKLLAVAAVLTMIMVPAAAMSDGSDASGDGFALVDWGNGVTEWRSASSGGTNGDVLTASFPDLVIEFGTEIKVEGRGTSVTGAASGSGSYSQPGTTGNQTVAKWQVYSWDAGAWAPASYTDVCNGYVSLGYYPDGYFPVETPEYRSSWVMLRGDSLQTGHTDAGTESAEPGNIKWTQKGYVYAAMLHADDCMLVKYGVESVDARVVCYDYATGNVNWEFRYPGAPNFETGTPAIVGDTIFVPSALGYVFKFDWRDGPGTLDESTGRYSNPVMMTDVDSGPREFVYGDIKDDVGTMPSNNIPLIGLPYDSGNTSIIVDSGTILFSNSNGMTYCLDFGLNLLWSYQAQGSIYFTTPTVYGDYVFVGSLDGALQVLNRQTGELIDRDIVFQIDYHGHKYGSVAPVSVIESDGVMYLLFSVSGGRGMNTVDGGCAVYTFDGTGLSKVKVDTGVGLTSNYFVPYVTETFKGCLFHGPDGIYSLDIDGNVKHFCGGLSALKAPLTMVNEEYLIVPSYAPGKPMYKIGLDGKILSTFVGPTSLYNYCMSPALVIGDWVFMANDSGICGFEGAFKEYVYPDSGSSGGSFEIPSFVYIILGIAAGIFALYCIIRFGMGKDRPFRFLKESFNTYVTSDAVSHNTRSRHRLIVMVTVGLIMTVAVCIASLCIGPTLTLNPGEMFSALVSAIKKGGQDLTYEEMMVFSSRMPRTLVALAVGIGLSVAGVIYQAIIRNPLVDPYIMGVSAGAGTAAVATMAFNFTFFGLFTGSIYLTAASAMVGGVIAFFITMLIAEKSGGTSINYVLAGVVVGMVFSAVQSLMLIMGSNSNISNSLTWLFGSFANVSWNQVAIVFFPVMGMSLASLIWAKELNLVLLGEDQAKQMGLNVRRFNRFMLILASLLASLCVAFVGIIGFVGLVVPHLCRMVLGGDHRLVLPSSIAFGGFLMIAADLAARTVWYGMELPVGAITTIIGVPVFAWLLIRKGRMYDG